jgi:CheY-like chemotaxis protein
MAGGNVILLVEDNRDDEHLTRRALAASGIASEIVVAHDGIEALEYLFGTNARGDVVNMPRLVLLDIALPDKDGFRVLKRIRADARARHVPVVVFSAGVGEQDVLHSYSLGANAFVRKPVQAEMFAETLETVAKFWLRFNERPAGQPTS